MHVVVDVADARREIADRCETISRATTQLIHLIKYRFILNPAMI